MNRLRNILVACSVLPVMPGVIPGMVLGVVLGSVTLAPGVAHAQQESPRFEQGGAPESFRRFVRDLEPVERRAVMRRMRRMRPEDRQRFFTRWEELSEAERAERRDSWRREFRARGGGEGADAVDLPEELRRRLDSLDPAERRETRESLRQLPQPQRRRLRRALENWDRLTPAQQDRVRRNVEKLQRFSKERRERIERNRPAWEGMETDQRDAMRRRLERFRELDPGQQEALVRRRFGNRSAEEQARILDRLRRGEPPR